nr:PREDICTED: charged multivesicular body protein 2b [Phalacrocorax carbo]
MTLCINQLHVTEGESEDAESDADVSTFALVNHTEVCVVNFELIATSMIDAYIVNNTCLNKWMLLAFAVVMVQRNILDKTVFSLWDIIKEQNRELRGTQRAITRDRAALEKQEKQLELEIKKMAKTGNKEACKVLAKQLVQLRKQKNRTYAVSSKVTSMSTQTKVMNSQMKMAGAMSTTAKTMQAVNKKMDPQKTLQTMQNFQKENMKMEMTEEMINDTLDDIFDASDEEEESQDIVNQVLDEIGIEISGKMAKAPSAARGLPSASTSKAATISDEEIERQLKALGVD